MVSIISSFSIVRRDYFRSQQWRNYRRNYSLSSEIRGSIEYTAPVPLMVTGIVDFDTDSRLILDLGVKIENCNKWRTVYKEHLL